MTAHEIALGRLLSECAELRRRAELAEALAREVQAQRDQAEEDAAALREAADKFHYAVVMNKAFDGHYDALTIERSTTLMDHVRASRPGASRLTELAAARADNAALLQLARSAVECVRKLCYDDGTDAAVKQADRWMHGFEQALQAEHPGASLQSELAFARAVVEAIKTNRIGGRCAMCGDLEGHKESCVIGRYDAAVKAMKGE